ILVDGAKRIHGGSPAPGVRTSSGTEDAYAHLLPGGREMIIPIFIGSRDFSRAPMTWVLVGLCLFIYLSTLTMEPFYRSPLLEKRQLQFTGILYLQFLQRSDVPGPSELLLLGGRALRDPSFLHVSPTYAFTGDDREITQWRGHLQTYI